MRTRRLAFWLVLISVGMFIVAPAFVLQYADRPQEMPLWMGLMLKLNAVVLGLSVFYLWIDAWRRLLRFWDLRTKMENYGLLIFLIFGTLIAAMYFYFRKEEFDDGQR
jgi:hypothetical protein